MKFINKFLINMLIITLMMSCGHKKKPILFLPNLTEESSIQSNFKEVPVITNDQSTDQTQQTSQSTQTTANDSSNNQNNQLVANVNNNNSYQATDFNFNTTHTVSLNISVTDVNGPVSNANVNVVDPNLMGTILYQSVTDTNGVVNGNFTVPSSTEVVNVNVVVGEYIATQTLNLTNSSGVLTNVNSNIVFNQDVDNYVVQAPDSDGDGVQDLLDSFPDDPNLATRVVFPNTGVATIAYEDLYPIKGDADFNDLVVQVTNEELLNAQGEVVKIKGKYKILARGAGYSHTLLLNLPGSGVYSAKIYNGSNVLLKEITTNVNTFQKLPIFIKNEDYFQNGTLDNTNLYFTNEMCSGMCNVYSSNPVVSSYVSEIELTFSTPFDKTTLSTSPYDLFIYVSNTKKEIHRPGFYFKPDGKDEYLDSDGFPWALVIPYEWNWPLERKNIVNAYPYFDDWYQSEGQQYNNWYMLSTTESKTNQFIYFNLSSGIANFLLQFGHIKNFILWVSLAILTSGILVFLFIKGRNPYQMY